jgi:hypothetical protein
MSQQPSKKSSEQRRRKPLDPNAADELQRELDRLRQDIIDRADQTATEDTIQSEDVYHAYKAIVDYRDEPVDSQAIISTALRENRICEVISYILAIAIFAAGLSLVISAGFGDAPLEARIGSLAAGSLLEMVLPRF